MPQIRVCPTCNKVVQTGETHKCPYMTSGYATCEKCGEKYPRSGPHICTTGI